MKRRFFKVQPITIPGPIFPFAFDITIPAWAFFLANIFVVITGIVIAIGIILLFVWPFVLATFWQQVIVAAESLWFRAGATSLLAMFGLLLYIARTFWRAWYGAAEIIVGIAGCWAGLGISSSTSFSSSLSVVGGVYVIVRGIDNLQQGRLQRRKFEDQEGQNLPVQDA